MGDELMGMNSDDEDGNDGDWYENVPSIASMANGFFIKLDVGDGDDDNGGDNGPSNDPIIGGDADKKLKEKLDEDADDESDKDDDEVGDAGGDISISGTVRDPFMFLLWSSTITPTSRSKLIGSKCFSDRFLVLVRLLGILVE